MADDLLAQQNPLYAQILASQIGQGQQGIALPQTLQARLASALAQQKEGLDMSPIRSGWQGLARMANAALGGYGQYQAEQEAAHIPQRISVGNGTVAVTPYGQVIPNSFVGSTTLHDIKAGDVSAPIAVTGTPGGYSAAPLGTNGGPPGVQGTAPAAPVNPIAETIKQGQELSARGAGLKKSAETSGEEESKFMGSVRSGLAGSGVVAAQQKQNIGTLNDILEKWPTFTPGAGGDSALALQRMAAQFGIDSRGAQPREVFNMVAARVLADQFSGIKTLARETGEQGGRIFKSFLELEEKATITPQDSLEGIRAKLKILDKAGDLQMKWADKADDYVAAHGRLDAGFNKTLRHEIANARIDVMSKGPQQVQQGPQFSYSRDQIEAEMERRRKLQQQ